MIHMSSHDHAETKNTSPGAAALLAAALEALRKLDPKISQNRAAVFLAVVGSPGVSVAEVAGKAGLGKVVTGLHLAALGAGKLGLLTTVRTPGIRGKQVWLSPAGETLLRRLRAETRA
jgi:hypothetical protein